MASDLSQRVAVPRERVGVCTELYSRDCMESIEWSMWRLSGLWRSSPASGEVSAVKVKVLDVCLSVCSAYQ